MLNIPTDEPKQPDVPVEILETAALKLKPTVVENRDFYGHDDLRPTPIGPDTFEIKTDDKDVSVSIRTQGPFWIIKDQVIGFAVHVNGPSPLPGVELDDVRQYYFRKADVPAGWKEEFEFGDVEEAAERARLLGQLL